jgi:hypothetical protein
VVEVVGVEVGVVGVEVGVVSVVISLSLSQAIHRTLYRRDRETTMRAQRKQKNLDFKPVALNSTETEPLTKTNLATAKSKPCGVNEARTNSAAKRAREKQIMGAVSAPGRAPMSTETNEIEKKGPRAGVLQCRRQNPTPRIPGRHNLDGKKNS